MTYKPCNVYLIFKLNKDNRQFAKLSNPAQLKILFSQCEGLSWKACESSV